MIPEHKLLLDDFGRTLMDKVRDDANECMERVLSGRMAEKTSKEYYLQYKSMSAEDAKIADRLISVAIDACLARILNCFDTQHLPLLRPLATGEVIDLRHVSGGLVGELYSDEGWIARFSRFPRLET